MTKLYIQEYITDIQKDLSKLAGVSALSNLLELKKIALVSMSEHELKYGKSEKDDKYITVKVTDKIKAIETVNKMLGFNDSEKVNIDHTTKGDKIKSIAPIEWIDGKDK